MNNDGDSSSITVIPFSGRQAVKGCIAALQLISTLHYLFTVNLATGMADEWHCGWSKHEAKLVMQNIHSIINLSSLSKQLL